MKTKTQSKLTLKHIKIRLTGKEQLRNEILEKIVKQGKRQGLQRSEFYKFGNKIFDTHPTDYLKLTKRVFSVEIK
jgi:ACT domain-containing protein